MEGTFTTDIVHVWLQNVADGAYVSLHYDSPGLGGVGVAEISGGGYARFKAAFTPPSNRAIWTITDIKFTGLLANRLTHFGIWNAQNQGTLLAYAALPRTELILNGQGYLITTGDMSLSIG